MNFLNSKTVGAEDAQRSFYVSPLGIFCMCLFYFVFVSFFFHSFLDLISPIFNFMRWFFFMFCFVCVSRWFGLFLPFFFLFRMQNKNKKEKLWSPKVSWTDWGRNCLAKIKLNRFNDWWNFVLEFQSFIRNTNWKSCKIRYVTHSYFSNCYKKWLFGQFVV